MRKSGKQMAQELSDFLNSAMGFEKEELVQSLLTDHRTLQQETFDIVYRLLAGWHRAHKSGYYDARNESACKLSHKMIETINKGRKM